MCVANNAYAEYVFLKDGSRLQGKIIERNEEGVRIQIEYGEIFVAHDDLASSSPKKEVPAQKSITPQKQRSSVPVVKIDMFAGSRIEGEHQGMKYVLYLPSVYDKARKVPLIVGLDPSGNGEGYMNFWEATAEAHGYAVVCPSTAGGPWRVDEDKKIVGMVKSLYKEYAINHRRIYATGFSGGGVFTYSCGINNPDVFTAIAPVCAAMQNIDSWLKYSKTDHVPVLIIHGSNDAVAGATSGREARNKLKRYGYAVTYKEIKGMGHESRTEELDLIVDFFSKYKF